MAEPYCLAMVLCDDVHRDPATGKTTILGTFNNFLAKRFPAKVKLAVYFAITDGLGPTVVRVQIVNSAGGFIDARSDEPDPHRVFSVRTELNLDDPLAVVESAFGVETTLPAEGVYHVELWANNEVLMSRRLSATLVAGQGE